MNQSKPTTIYDLAEATGLSPASVSKIINNKGSYSVKTRQKVFDMIKIMGYTPNIKARKLASKNTNVIGIEVDNAKHNNAFFHSLILGAFDRTLHYGYNLTLYNQVGVGNQNSLSSLHEFDGIIFPLSSMTLTQANYINYLNSINKPFVYLGDQKSFDDKERNVYGGYFDYICFIIKYFHSIGKKRIVLFPQTSNHEFLLVSQNKLQEMINDILDEYNLPDDFCILDSYDENNPQTIIKQVDTYYRKHSIDALFLNSIPCTIMIYNHLQQSGIHIPNDISIISTTNNILEGTSFFPPLSTILVDSYKMGQRAVDLILHQINPDKYPKCDNNVPYTFIKRESD